VTLPCASSVLGSPIGQAAPDRGDGDHGPKRDRDPNAQQGGVIGEEEAVLAGRHGDGAQGMVGSQHRDVRPIHTRPPARIPDLAQDQQRRR
jgi:hypothetical protein